MEKVTPLDLERAQLPEAFRGYRKEAVDKLLQIASVQMETQLVEIKRLSALLKNSESELERFRSQESTLSSALVLAQKAGDETRMLAQKEAELIIEGARQEAKEIKRSAQESVRVLQWEAERLQGEKASFTARFKALISEYVARLEEDAPTHAVLQVEQNEAAAG